VRLAVIWGRSLVWFRVSYELVEFFFFEVFVASLARTPSAGVGCFSFSLISGLGFRLGRGLESVIIKKTF
jgi:hypothetical protein